MSACPKEGVGMRVLMCVVLALAVVAVARAEDEKAVQTLKSLKAFIIRDSKQPGMPVIRASVPNLKTGDVKKAMDAVRSLKNLRQLSLMNSHLGDEGAKGLGELKELRHLT